MGKARCALCCRQHSSACSRGTRRPQGRTPAQVTAPAHVPSPIRVPSPTRVPPPALLVHAHSLNARAWDVHILSPSSHVPARLFPFSGSYGSPLLSPLRVFDLLIPTTNVT